MDTDLKSLAKRIDALLDERDARNEDIREVYTEAKSAGHDVKALRRAISEKRKREKDPQKFDDEAETVERVKAELGFLDGTPLGDAAVRALR